MKDLLAEFERIDTDNNGRIDRDEFLSMCTPEQENEKVSVASRKYFNAFFDLFDTDGSEDLDLKEFVQMCVMFEGTSDHHRANLAFRLLDLEDMKGYLDLDEIALDSIPFQGRRINEAEFCALVVQHGQVETVLQRALNVTGTGVFSVLSSPDAGSLRCGAR